MASRIFIAALLSEDVQYRLFSWGHRHLTIPLRLIPRHQLHVTLIPPFYCKDTDALSVLLEDFSVESPFPIMFNQVCYGPKNHKPRLVWALGDAHPDLLQLKKALEQTLFSKGLLLPGRAFRLHVTLARFNPETAMLWKDIPLDVSVSWKDTLTSFQMLLSESTTSGVQYRVLKTISLLGEGGK